MTTLLDLLYDSEALEKRASLRSGVEQEALLSKKAMIDIAAFGMFKESAFGQALEHGLGWGVGLGLPALGVGGLLLNNAKNQAKDVVHDARNQALLTGAGLGTMNAVGQGLGAALQPRNMESTREETYPGGDIFRTLHSMKVSALRDLLILDSELSASVNASKDKTAAECFVLNREKGAALLREILS